MAEPAKVSTIRLVEFGDSKLVPAKIILKRAKQEKLESVLIVGRDESGELWASSSLNAGQSLWLLEKLKERLLEGNPWAIV